MQHHDSSCNKLMALKITAYYAYHSQFSSIPFLKKLCLLSWRKEREKKVELKEDKNEKERKKKGRKKK